MHHTHASTGSMLRWQESAGRVIRLCLPAAAREVALALGGWLTVVQWEGCPGG